MLSGHIRDQKRCSLRVRPEQDPGAVVPHAGICAGGAPQGAFLLRLLTH